MFLTTFYYNMYNVKQKVLSNYIIRVGREFCIYYETNKSPAVVARLTGLNNNIFYFNLSEGLLGIVYKNLKVYNRFGVCVGVVLQFSFSLGVSGIFTKFFNYRADSFRDSSVYIYDTFDGKNAYFNNLFNFYSYLQAFSLNSKLFKGSILYVKLN